MECISVAPAGVCVRLDPAHEPQTSKVLHQTAFRDEGESSFGRFSQT